LGIVVGGKKIAFIQRLAGMAIGAVFICAGALKAFDPAQFAGDIANYRLLAHTAGAALALYLPWLEIVCGAALIFKKSYRGALLILTALCLVFLAALVSAKARGLDISCGCFGHAHPHPLALSLLLDSALLATLILLLVAEFRRPGPAAFAH
jgi:putative oxidoreductase